VELRIHRAQYAPSCFGRGGTPRNGMVYVASHTAKGPCACRWS
jgi:hypothetical protein